MSTNSCVATVLTLLPKAYLTACHRASLEACNIAVVDSSDPAAYYLYSCDGEGPSDLELPEGLEMTADLWEEFLEMSGLDDFRHDPFVALLREAMAGGGIDWTRVLQLVLREIPQEVLAHVDVQGSYWCDKERRGEFGGFALRVTRSEVVAQESAQQFFDRLDAQAPATTANGDRTHAG